VLFIATGSRALASDGVVEINAAQVLVGGITPGDAAGYPVQITRPGSYRLTGSLDVSALPGAANVTAISIESSDVDLDLAGFAVIGPAACGGFPFACAPSGSGSGVRSLVEDRTAVHDGSIRGFGRVGILLQSDSRITGVTVSNCAQGGINAGTGSLISDNVVSLNGGPGIQLVSGVVRNNSVRGSVFFGIYVSSNATVVNNTVIQTQSSGANPGVAISAGDTCTVIGNTVTGNQGLGLSLSPFTGFHGNVISGNNGFGNPPQTSGGIELGPNLCGTDTVCP
jgi:hypothetical protein